LAFDGRPRVRAAAARKVRAEKALVPVCHRYHGDNRERDHDRVPLETGINGHDGLPPPSKRWETVGPRPIETG